tara:strand:+ start:492 stop:683 length:192 start_codon:yes stop_codon:yes gene_type:complete
MSEYKKGGPKTFYVKPHQNETVKEFCELVDVLMDEARRTKKQPKTMGDILIEYMDYYVKKNKK